MKHQQVVVDYWTMLKASCTCLLLAISGYVLIKMVQTIFYLPGYLKNNQKRLEELAAKYNLDLEKEITEAEEIDRNGLLEQNENDDDENKNEKENRSNLKKSNIDHDELLDKEPKKVK